MEEKRGKILMNTLLPKSLSVFTRRCFKTLNSTEEYLSNWHLDAIAHHLEACKDGEIKRLIINVPPRSLKSTFATIAFPAWLMGHDPTAKIIAASYAKSLSNKHSQDTRHIMSSQWYKGIFPKTIITKDQNEKSKFMTTERGHRLAVSVGSSTTGEGGNYLLVDDPLNPAQAASDIERQNANDWFQQTFVSRLNNPADGVIIVVMQRLHEDDLSGFLLRAGGWEHLCLPAVNDKKRTISIGKNKVKEWEAGELLHEDHLTEEVLARRLLEMGTYAYHGQYMQVPTPAGGGIIKDEWWKLWKHPKTPRCDFVLQVYDTAYGIKETNDYSARTTWGIFYNEDTGHDNIILIERLNARLEFPQLRDQAIESYNQYDPDIVLIEAKASGMPLIQEFRKAGLRVRPIERHRNAGDKVQRAHAVTIVFEQGVVWVPCIARDVNGQEVWEPRSFAKDVISQCSMFPNGVHDDLVDTVVDALQFLRQYKNLRVSSDKEHEEPIVDRSKRRRLYA